MQNPNRRDFKIALFLAVVCCALSSAPFVIPSLVIGHAVPAVVWTILQPFAWAGGVGLVIGALFGGFAEGSVHGARTAFAILIFAVPINLSLFTVLAFLVIKLVRWAAAAVRRTITR